MSTTSGTRRPSAMWKVVAHREIATQLRSKSFLLTAGFLALSLVAMVVVLTLTSGRTSTHEVAVVDDTGRAAVEAGNDIADRLDRDAEFEVVEVDDAEAAEDAVLEGDADVALLPTDDGYELVGDGEVDGAISQVVGTAVSQQATERNARAQDVDLEALAAGTVVQERLLDEDAEDAGLREAASFVFVLLFYVIALGFGLTIAQTVTQEKESRVVEILAAAVPIRALLWGKIIGVSVLAIGQTVVLVLVGVGALLATDNTHALSVLGPAIIWYVVFFVLGFVALASLWSVAGSLAGRQQDLGGTTAPLQIVLFAPYILAFTAGEGIRTVVSMMPIVSTMMMPSRLAEGDVPLWQLLVAVVTTVLAAVLLVGLSVKVYERTVLQTGRRIGFREALKS